MNRMDVFEMWLLVTLLKTSIFRALVIKNKAKETYSIVRKSHKIQPEQSKESIVFYIFACGPGLQIFRKMQINLTEQDRFGSVLFSTEIRWKNLIQTNSMFFRFVCDSNEDTQSILMVNVYECYCVPFLTQTEQL